MNNNNIDDVLDRMFRPTIMESKQLLHAHIEKSVRDAIATSPMMHQSNVIENTMRDQKKPLTNALASIALLMSGHSAEAEHTKLRDKEVQEALPYLALEPLKPENKCVVVLTCDQCKGEGYRLSHTYQEKWFCGPHCVLRYIKRANSPVQRTLLCGHALKNRGLDSKGRELCIECMVLNTPGSASRYAGTHTSDHMVEQARALTARGRRVVDHPGVFHAVRPMSGICSGCGVQDSLPYNSERIAGLYCCISCVEAAMFDTEDNNYDEVDY